MFIEVSRLLETKSNRGRNKKKKIVVGGEGEGEGKRNTQHCFYFSQCLLLLVEEKKNRFKNWAFEGLTFNPIFFPYQVLHP